MKKKELLKRGLALFLAATVGLQPTLAYAAEIVENDIQTELWEENALELLSDEAGSAGVEALEELHTAGEVQIEVSDENTLTGGELSGENVLAGDELAVEDELVNWSDEIALDGSDELLDPSDVSADEELVIEDAVILEEEQEVPLFSSDESGEYSDEIISEAGTELPGETLNEAEIENEILDTDSEEIETLAAVSSGDFLYEELNGSYIAISGYTGTETEVVIPGNIDGYIVQKIANEAFMDNANVTKVTLPDSCVTVGERAFKNCSALTEFVCGSSLETLDHAAFENCTALETVAFNENLTVINSLVFAGCASLADITLPQSLDTIGGYAFKECTALVDADLPDSVTSIGYRAFYNCTGLETFDYPTNWTTSGGYSSYPTYYGSTFEGCTALTEITVPEGVSSIPAWAFSYCTSVEEFHLPSTLVKIGEHAFKGCTGIDEIGLPDALQEMGNYAFAECSNLVLTTLPESLDTIGAYTFSQCTSIASMDFSDSVTSIGYRAFYNCTSLAEIEYPTCLRECSGYSSYPTYYGNIFEGCSSLTSVNVPEGVTELPAYVFSGNVYLKEVTLPSTLTNIGAYAFDSSSGLRTITIPDAVTEIGDCAFRDCTGITSFDFGSGLTTIGHFAFESCESIKSLELPDSITSIGYRAFYNCTALSQVNYPKNWTTCSGYSSYPTYYGKVFEGCTSLKTITIPEGVTVIPQYAFAYAEALKRIQLPETVTALEDYAFSACTSLTRVYVGSAVSSIGDHTFADSDQVTIYGVSGSYAEEYAEANAIAFSAEGYLSGLSVISGTVTDENGGAAGVTVQVYDVTKGELTGIYETDEDGAWVCDEALEGHAYTVRYYYEGYEFAENVQKIESAANEETLVNTVLTKKTTEGTVITADEVTYSVINGSNIEITKYNGTGTSLIVPEEIDGYTVQKIGKEAFKGNTDLQEIILGDTIEEIAEKAFYGCSALSYIGFSKNLKTIGLYAFSNCTGLEKVVFSGKITTIGNFAFEACTALTDLTFTESLATVGAYAFSGCTGLTAIELPDSVSSIGYRAFYNCSNLASFEYPMNWSAVGGYSSYPTYYGNLFEGCQALTSITVPEGVTEIPAYAFANSTYIEKVILPSTLKTIGESAFNGCTGIEHIELPESLTEIKNFAFEKCSNLVLTTLPSSLESIGSYAFSQCTAISSMDFPESVTSIGYRAFYNCTALAEIGYPEGITVCSGYSSYPTYYGNIFEGCSSLSSVTVPEGVTELPSYILSGCIYLKEVTLPSTLTKIGAYAFDKDSGLRTVTIPDEVTEIGDCAFRGCTGITSFEFGSKLTTIGHYAFESCEGIKSLELPDSITAIGYRAFYNCISLTKVNYPMNWTTSTGYSSYPTYYGKVFEGCEKLRTVTLPEGVTVIPKYAFMNAVNIARIQLPDTVTTLEDYAFSGCTELKRIYIGANVSSIGDNTFKDSTQVTIYGESGSYAEEYAAANGIAFSTEEYLAGLSVISGTVTDENGGVGGVTVLVYDVTEGKLIGTFETDETGAWMCDEAASGHAYRIRYYREGYEFEQSVQEIASAQTEEILTNTVTEKRENTGTVIPAEELTYSVLNGSYIEITAYTGSGTSLIVPEEIGGYTVQKIGKEAFKGHTQIEEIILCDTIEEIGEKAFYGCSALNYVGFSKNLKTIGAYAFSNCTGLESIEFSGSVTSIGNFAFEACTSLSAFGFTESLTTVGAYAFSGCTGLTEIAFPDSVSSIGYRAFYNCTALTVFDYPMNWNTVGGYSSYPTYYGNIFEGCSALTSITVPEGITEIPAWAFANSTYIEEVNLPSTLTAIGEEAFCGCTGIVSIELPESLTEIKNFAFEKCSNLVLTTLPSNVESIGAYAFSRCTSITEMNFPESVTSIGYRAFYNCTALASIEYPVNLAECSGYSSYPTYYGGIFDGCSSLKSVTVPEGVTVLPDYLFSEADYLEEISLPSTLTKIGANAFEEAIELKSVTVPDAVTEIGNHAFKGCSSLASAELGSGLTSIGAYAFENCTVLESISLPDSITAMGYRVFYNCTALSAVNYPKSWTTCTGYSSYPTYYGSVFEGCTKLRILTIPEGVTAIPAYAFRNCSSLRTITFPSTLTTIGEYAFEGCKGMPNLPLNTGLKEIGRYAFSKCDGLISVTVPSTVEKIGEGAFADCINLVQAFVPESVTEMGSDVFENCPICLYVVANSYAARWAVGSGVDFRYYADGTQDYSNYVLDMTSSSFYTNTDVACVDTYIKIYLNYKIADEHLDEVSDTALYVKLAPSLEFVMGSLKEGSFLRDDYTYEDTVLTIPVTEQEGQFTFNAKVLASGNLSAYACFDYEKDNTACSDLIDMMILEVPTLTVDVPEVTAKTLISVSGLTAPKESVTVYVDGQAAAQVKAKNTGSYSTYINLPEPEVNKQEYTIKVECVSNTAVYTEKTVVYDAEAPVLTRFDMYYTAHESKKVNMLAAEGSQLTLAINPNCGYTFRIEFDNPETLKNVYVVGTRNGITKTMQAEPTAKPGEYIATGHFHETYTTFVPGSISLQYTTKFDGSGISGSIDLEEEDLPESCQNAEVDVLSDDGANAKVNITLQDGTVLPVEFREYASLDEAAADLITGSASTYSLARTADSEWDDVAFFIDQLVEKYGDQVKSNTKDKAEENGVVVIQDGEDLIYILWNGVTGTVKKVFVQAGVAFWLREETCFTTTMPDAWGYAGMYIGLGTTFIEGLNLAYQMDEAQKEIRNSDTLSDADKEYALQKVEDMKVAYGLLYTFKMVMNMARPYITTTVTAAYGPIAGFLVGVVIDYGMNLVENYLDGAFDYYKQGGKGSYFKWLIDPSGYVYEAVTTNRIAGAKVTAYYKETLDSDAVLWDASEYGQENPLYTDSEGCYAWDTPEGYWQVVVELDGYDTWTSEWLSVPPVQDNVNAAMVSYEAPQAEWINVYEEYAEIHFTKYMKPDTVSEVILMDEDGNELAYTLSYSEEETSEDGTVYADTYRFVFDAARVKGTLCKVTVPTAVQSYAGVGCAEQSYSRTVKVPCTAEIEEQASVDYGSRIVIPVVLSSYDEETVIEAVSAFPELARIIGVEKSETEGTWNVIVEGRMPGATEILITVKDTDIAVTVPVTINMNSTFAGFDDEEETETETDSDETETDPDETETNPDETETNPDETETDPDETETNSNETEKETETQPHTHTWNKGSVGQAATCAKEGYMIYTCTGCGETKQEAIPKDSSKHQYGDYVAVKEPTVSETGIKEKTCSVCGAKEREEIEVLEGTIKLNATSITLKVRQSTTKVKVSGLAAGDSVKSWKSSNTKIVKVTKSGKITAQKKTGRAVLTVTLKSGTTATVKVKVQKSTVKTKKISGVPKKLTMKVKEKWALEPVISPITSVQKVTYSTSNKRVATVSKKGVITAKKTGRVKITVKSGAKRATVTVTVKKK